VLGDYAAADEALLVAAMNDLAWTYARVNAAPDVLSPEFAFIEPEDYAARADLDGKLHDVGVRFTKVHFQDAYGLAEEEFELEADPGGKPGPEPAPDGGRFAAAPEDDSGGNRFTPEQQTLEDLVASVLPEAESAAAGLVERVAEAIRRAESFEDLALLLAEELSTQGDAFQEVLERAVLAADMWGRYSARQDGAD
jgi:phage gp29-like protein